MKSTWSLIAAIVGGLLLGFGVGMLYAWIISPVAYTDVPPASLRADFKDQFRLAIAGAYAANGNLPRARVRLALLGDTDSAQALMDQARRAGSLGGSPASALALTGLAQAIGPASGAGPTETPTSQPSETATPRPLVSPTRAGATPAAGSPTSPRPSLTPADTVTPRPSPSPSSTPGSPFVIVTNKPVCDEALQPGLLQVIVKDGDGKQVAGEEIIIAWQGGQESFFTGLKPELGDGYADFVMQAGVVYSLRLAADSETANDLNISPCQKADGSPYGGGIQIIFQQP